MHYLRWYRTGDTGEASRRQSPPKPKQSKAAPLTLEQRFWAKVDKTDTCWLWTASLGRNGYGQFKTVAVGQRYAHRIAYTWLVGPIPAGLQLDHLCRVRHCVNPDHLEPVTQQENIRRGLVGSHNSSKTHCIRGHAFDEANTYLVPGGRSCRECRRTYQHRVKST